MSGTIKIGMIGLSSHWGYLFQALDEYPSAHLVCVAILKEERQTYDQQVHCGRIKEEAKLYRFEDYTSMLDELRPDVVYASEPMGYHFDVICACLERDIHVIVEKPLCCTMEQLEQIQAKREKSGVKVNALLNMRFDSLFQRARELVQAGRIGQVGTAFGQKSYKCGVRPWWYHTRETYCGTIPFIACHLVDLIRWITGREFATVAAFHNNCFHPQFGTMEDSAALAFTLDNGACGAMTLDYLRPESASTHGDDRIRLAGNQAVIEVRRAEHCIIVVDEKKEEVINVPDQQGSIFADFLAGIYGGKEPLLDDVTPFEVTRVCLLARQAAETGRVIQLR